MMAPIYRARHWGATRNRAGANGVPFPRHGARPPGMKQETTLFFQPPRQLFRAHSLAGLCRRPATIGGNLCCRQMRRNVYNEAASCGL